MRVAIRATLVSNMPPLDNEPLIKPSPIGIAGTGRLAQSLGHLLVNAGQPVVAVAGREPGKAAHAAAFIGPEIAPVSIENLPAVSSRILIAVTDDALVDVAGKLASGGMSDGVALHTSGARSAHVLQSLEARGVSCGVLHPLQTIATPEQGVEALPGSSFAVIASGAAAAWALEIVALLNGKALNIQPAHQPLYHAAAVMASNYIVALVDAAVILMEEVGIERPEALRALQPLLNASAANAIALTPAVALTGPIERRDFETVDVHLKALEGLPPTVRGLYRSAGRHTVDLARRKNPGADYSAMERLLSKGIG